MKKSYDDEDFNVEDVRAAQKYLEGWERARIAVSAPHYEDLRMMLRLDVERYCKLIDIDEVTYWKWKSGEAQPSIDQKILFRRIFDIAKRKGLLFL